MSYGSRDLARMTAHAQTRAQQRGIRDVQIKLIEIFGQNDLQKGGDFYAFIPDKTLSDLRRAIDSLSGIAMIKGDQDQIVTVMHEYRKTRRTQYAA